MTIYALCNTVTGEAYIGQTTKALATRFQAHLSTLRCGRHCNTALQVAWGHDGAEAFGLMVLERHNGEPIKVESLESSWYVRARAAGIALYNDQMAKGRKKAA